MKALGSMVAGVCMLYMTGTAVAQSAADDAEQRPLTVDILHMNDHHSHLAEDSFDFDVSDLLLRTVRGDGSPITEVEVAYGGFPRMVELFSRLERSSRNPIKIHAGDAITGTSYFSLFKGEADAALMKQICFDVFSLGNHEFDEGDQGLADFLDFLIDGTCDTAVLGANVVPGPASPLQDSPLEPFTIMEFDGQRIGLIGINVAGKTLNSSNPDEGTDLLDELTTAQLSIDLLREEGVDKIILVTHIQYLADIDLAENLSGVDVIVGGDSHTLLGDETLAEIGLPVMGPYPTVTTDLDGNPVCIVQAWEYTHFMGHLRVRFDADGNVSSCEGSPVAPIERNFVYADVDAEGNEFDNTLSGTDRLRVLRSLTRNPEFRRVPEDQTTAALLAGFDAEVDILAQTVIGEVAEDLCLVRWPNDGRSTICPDEATYLQGSDISNLVAKAFLAVTRTADFAIQNAGGVRVDVPAGEYTINDAFSLLPFSNTLVILDLTGEEIVNVLEDALSNTLDDGGSTGSYPYAAGIRYDVDASQPFGSRISNVEINPRVDIDDSENLWAPIDLAETYRVVTNDFIASGRDGYDSFIDAFNDPDRVEDTFTEYAQGWIDYIEAVGVVTRLPLEEYSTKSYIGTSGCDHSIDDSCEGF